MIRMERLFATVTMRTLALLAALSSVGLAQRPAPKTATPTAAVPDTVSRNEQREDPAPAPARSEGEGPFPRLVIRGVTLIDGYGGPPRGPVDINVDSNRIVD